MTRYFLFSFIIHGALLSGIFIAGPGADTPFSIKKGLSVTIAPNTERPINERKNHNIIESSGDLKIIISPAGYFSVENSGIAPEKMKTKQKNSGTTGTIHAKADILSRNNPPDYPYVARKMGHEGEVILDIEVLPSGDTGRVRVIKSSGHGSLDSSAISAARGWVFFRKGELSLDGPVVVRKKIRFILQGPR